MITVGNFGRFSLSISTVVGSFNDQNLCLFSWLPTRIDLLIFMYESKQTIQSVQSLYTFFMTLYLNKL